MAANIHRRNITKGQRAMAVAMIYPDPEKGGRGKKRLGDLTVSAERLSTARTVLQYAPDLATNVLTGSSSLDDAYTSARKRKKDASSNETDLADLRERYADLADMVVEGGGLVLAEARLSQGNVT